MDSLSDRVVLVTGASSGIGRSSALAFAWEGAKLLLVARRRERLEALAAELARLSGARSHCVELDVRDKRAVEGAIGSLPTEWSAIDVLVNNAGLARGLGPVHEGEPEDWEEMIDTNVKGLLYVTRAVVPGMLARNRGHIINVGSIAGREVYPGGSVYCATKFAVRALTQGLRVDLHGTPIRVTTVDPGLVETEFSLVRFRGDEKRASTAYQGTRPLTPDDVADAVVFTATRPPHVSVAELLLLPTDQASTTRIRRET
jgi:NADP-dependent 3-hydroxy acid dehydrogenase YdfG